MLERAIEEPCRRTLCGGVHLCCPRLVNRFGEELPSILIRLLDGGSRSLRIQRALLEFLGHDVEGLPQLTQFAFDPAQAPAHHSCRDRSQWSWQRVAQSGG